MRHCRSQMLDVIVVGGGPAGMAVAIGAADVGLSVAICERRPDVVDKACGEGLMPGTLRSLQSLAVDPEGAAIGGIVYRQGETVARAAFRSGAGRGVRRTALVAALRRAVSARGIELIAREVDGIEQSADAVTVAGLRARYVVAADGLHSGLRDSLGLSLPARGPRRWGLRRHFAVPPWDDFVEVSWAADAEAYVTPVSADLVGVAILSSRRSGFEAQLRDFPMLTERLAAAPCASGTRGAGPLTQTARRRVAGRVVLVGDAAGYVDALTGEGLGVSFSAAAALIECLVRDRLEDYETAWVRATRRSRLATTALLAARHNPLLHRRIVPAAARAPWLFSAAVDQLAR